MKEFVIKNHEEGQKLDKYLSKVLSQAPKSFLYKMLRKKNIVLNDKKADGHEVLKASDSIKIYFSDETFEKFADPAIVKGDTLSANNNRNQKISPKLLPTIVYEDQDIMIMNKPAGLLSQKAAANDYSANDFVLDYLLQTGQFTKEDFRTFKPSICNRLDRNTSGLLIAGKTMAGLQQMSASLKERDMAKYYLCLVSGKISEKQHLKGYLLKDEKSNRVTVRKEAFDGADYIETSYEPVKQYGSATLLLVHLITGRSHQIRAHLSSIGHPILGDYKYGNKGINDRLKKATGVDSQLLHAYRLVMPDGQRFEAAEPETFHKAYKYAQSVDKL